MRRFGQTRLVNIETIDGNAFAGLSMLELLTLHWNAISSFEPQVRIHWGSPAKIELNPIEPVSYCYCN